MQNSTVTMPAGTVDAKIIRNETERGIQTNDRVILRNVPAQDKNRHVKTKVDSSSLQVQTPYSADYASKPFVIGASMLGGSVGGTLTTGTLSTGRTQTLGGLADVYVTYPANINTIGVGCGDIPNRDLRYSPLGSAKVFLIAESSSATGDSAITDGSRYDDRATTIDEGGFCFAPMSGSAGLSLQILPSVKLSGTETRTLTLEDGGDGVPLPFWPVTSFVAVDARGKANVCRDTLLTNRAGCEGAGKEWIQERTVCYDLAFTSEADCKAGALTNSWVEVVSDFGVDVYINPFGKTGDPFDLDGDGKHDFEYPNAQHVNADGSIDPAGIPNDLNGDGKVDLYEGNVQGWKFDAVYGYIPQAANAAGTKFYTYPYTGIDASASALIVIRGDFIQTGDKATVTFASGDGETSVSVEMP